MTANNPEILEMNLEQVEQMLDRAAAKLDEDDAVLMRRIVESYAYLADVVGDKDTTIARLRKLMFGSNTEKADNILDEEEGDTQESLDDSSKSNEEPANDTTTNNDAATNKDTAASDDPDPESLQEPVPADTPTPAPGHGRYSADDYAGASQVNVSHPDLEAGDACPTCEQGTLYDKPPGVFVRFVGQAPLQATVYRTQKLRCHLCGQIFTAPLPQGVGDEKYDHTVASMIGLLKYGSGLPFNRLQRLQRSCEIPLAASTQWQMVRAAAELMAPAYEELIRQAAQGEVVHNDDTTVKILELMGQRAKKSPPSDDEHDPQRTGLFTSGIVALRAVADAVMRIALFFSGRQHAGENLADVLEQRAEELEAPIQMCDGLARNLPQELKTILANCVAHGRRKFVEIYDRFPTQGRHVIEAFKVIYYNKIASPASKPPNCARALFTARVMSPAQSDFASPLARTARRSHWAPGRLTIAP